MNDHKVIARINKLVKSDLHNLSPHLRDWSEEHLVIPRLINLSLLENGDGDITLWLVTDHVGFRDSSYRVVFDPEFDEFGLEVTLSNDVNWYMGRYGCFSDTIEAM